jgi:hypothetical protein
LKSSEKDLWMEKYDAWHWRPLKQVRKKLVSPLQLPCSVGATGDQNDEMTIALGESHAAEEKQRVE